MQERLPNAPREQALLREISQLRASLDIQRRQRTRNRKEIEFSRRRIRELEARIERMTK